MFFLFFFGLIVANKLKSEGLIPERRIGVDPRSPGVGNRIRDEKYAREKENKSNVRRPTSTAPKPSPSTSNKNNKNKNKNKNNDNNKPKLFEVLPELKRGTALLKYGRHGYPHFRQFNLSEDNTALRWFSAKKKLNKSEIKMKDIHDVITGQHTKEFERIKWTTLTPASFSIIYGEQKRSLNLVAKSVDEMKMWVEALRYLRNEAKKGNDLSKIKSVKVPVDFRDRNRPQSRKHSGNFLRSHETKDTQVNSELKNKLISDLDTLRNLYRDIEKEANNEVVQASPEYSSISQILSEIEERIGELDKEVRNTKNTKIAENDVWRTKIDLESLREKIRVLYKNNKSSFKKAKNGRRWSVF